MPAKNLGQQSIEELQRRWQKLNTAKIEAETQLKNARERLDELKREAMEKFGADDLDRLREMLAEMQRENERRRGEYQASLDEIESSLQKVEEDFERVDPAAPVPAPASQRVGESASETVKPARRDRPV